MLSDAAPELVLQASGSSLTSLLASRLPAMQQDQLSLSLEASKLFASGGKVIHIRNYFGFTFLECK